MQLRHDYNVKEIGFLIWILFVTGTLFAFTYFPPLWISPYVAYNNQESIQQYSVQMKDAPKEPVIRTARIQKDYSREVLTRYLTDAFATYGIEDQIPLAEQVIACESGFNVNPRHNNISWGVAQFTPSTWHDYGYGDIMNPKSQLEVMAKMWSQGLQKRWDCYFIVTNKLRNAQ